MANENEEKTFIRVLYVEPLKEPVVIEIEDDLRRMQELVGGPIEEFMPYEDDVAIICNEEGKMNGMALNRAIEDDKGFLHDIIAGPFFVAYAPIESETFLSLPEDLEEKYRRKFESPEIFYRGDAGIAVMKLGPQERAGAMEVCEKDAR